MDPISDFFRAMMTTPDELFFTCLPLCQGKAKGQERIELGIQRKMRMKAKKPALDKSLFRHNYYGGSAGIATALFYYVAARPFSRNGLKIGGTWRKNNFEHSHGLISQAA